jgi:uncharacterized membrane protein
VRLPVDRRKGACRAGGWHRGLGLSLVIMIALLSAVKVDSSAARTSVIPGSVSKIASYRAPTCETATTRRE